MKTIRAGEFCKKPAIQQSSMCCRRGRRGCAEGSWKPFTLPRENRNLLTRIIHAVHRPSSKPLRSRAMGLYLEEACSDTFSLHPNNPGQVSGSTGDRASWFYLESAVP